MNTTLYILVLVTAGFSIVNFLYSMFLRLEQLKLEDKLVDARFLKKRSPIGQRLKEQNSLGEIETPQDDAKPKYNLFPYDTKVQFRDPDGNVLKEIDGFEPHGDPIAFGELFTTVTGFVVTTKFIKNNAMMGTALTVCKKTKKPEYASQDGLKPIGYLYFKYVKPEEF